MISTVIIVIYLLLYYLNHISVIVSVLLTTILEASCFKYIELKITRLLPWHWTAEPHKHLEVEWMCFKIFQQAEYRGSCSISTHPCPWLGISWPVTVLSSMLCGVLQGSNKSSPVFLIYSLVWCPSGFACFSPLLLHFFCQVVFGQLHFLFPWGVHHTAVLMMLLESHRCTWPVHFKHVFAITTCIYFCSHWLLNLALNNLWSSRKRKSKLVGRVILYQLDDARSADIVNIFMEVSCIHITAQDKRAMRYQTETLRKDWKKTYN